MAWMPAGTKTSEELNAQLVELRERVRQSRIKRGLSPDPPKQKRKLPDTIAIDVLDRMDTFVEVCVEIARLYRAGIFEVIDTKRFDRYRTCARLLTRAEDFNVEHIGYKSILILAIISSINDRISEGDDDIGNYHLLHSFYDQVMKLTRDLPSAKGHQLYHMKTKGTMTSENFG
jgi:hypothetical protein